MIEVVGGQALADALGGITTGMTGQSLSEAWQSQGFDDPESHMVDYTTGSIESVTYRAKSIINGEDKPAISGDTTGSVSSSSDADPIDAFDSWSESNPGSVNSTTGGATLGSKVQTYAFSLLRTLNPETQRELIKAVVPIAVPAKIAYTAISQALGVSMNVAEQSLELQAAFLEAEREYQYTESLEQTELLTDFVAAWWDGVNILFPRKAVESIEETLRELGIGGDPQRGTATSGIVGGSVPLISGDTWTFSQNTYVVNANVSRTWQDHGTHMIYASPVSGPVGTRYYRDRTYPMESANNAFTYDNKTVYYYSSVAGEQLIDEGYFGEVPKSYNTGSVSATAWTMIYGNITHEGEYPSGTAQSSAPSYTSSSIPSAGGIATSPSDTIDTVAIQLYDDPLNTIGQTADPNGPTDQDIVGTLPESPPVELPVPATVPSNPGISIDDASVVDRTRVEAATQALSDSLRANPPKSTGIIGFPELPNISGAFPSIVPSSGPGLIHVYNPTPSEFISFGRWLWVTYADASIDKIWNNPFDGIVGAFELYSTPTTSGTDHIYSGFLTCPTTSKIVQQRYTELDCGTVIVPEFYGNYFDYSPYSQCYIYLPFIGINEVSIDDIVGHAVNIRYRIDSYNGSCIAMIYVAKDGYRNLCYQFAGNCAVEVPLAGGSQAAIKAGMIQAEAYARAAAIGGLVGGINSIGQGAASGAMWGGGLGAVAGALGGFANGVASGISSYTGQQASLESARVANKSSVQHSGQFGASHGAMGAKKPFIIIRNPIQVKIVNYNEDYGFPAHKRVVIGACKGYLRVREVNVVSAHATNEEKAAIESALKGGVYVE